MTEIVDIDSNTAHAVRTFLAKVSGQYDYSGAMLFGSRARRNYRPDSDADVVVLLRGQRGQFLDTKLALADIVGGSLAPDAAHASKTRTPETIQSAQSVWANSEFIEAP